MKKLILLVSLLSVTVLFSGCCHMWFWPVHHHGGVIVPVHHP